MKYKSRTLGVLGGLGPMSTFRFCSLLTAHTRAQSDADHIDMIISSRATTPDRTAFILGKSLDDPLPVMIEEAKKLQAAGAELIVIPCNTAHYFYEGLQEQIDLPIINIIEETVLHLNRMGVHRFGLLATEGTVRSGSYHRECKKHDMEIVVPNEEEQKQISEIIYGSVKQNKPADMEAFWKIAASLQDRGGEKLVLGCTELSLLDQSKDSDFLLVDSLDVLAWRTILACGKTPIGFPSSFRATEKGAES